MATKMLAGYTVNAETLKTRSAEGIADELARKVARAFLKTLDERELKVGEEITVSIMRFESLEVA